jgi:hypothetical protein
MKRCLALSSLAVLSLFVLYRGAARADPTPAPNPGAAKKIDWEHMSFAERKKVMKSSVFPELKKAFQAADPKRFKKFTCATCHGEAGVTGGKFKMPNSALPKLPGDHAGMTALEQKKPEIFKFMETVVKPKVAELIGISQWTPQNPKGIGCYTCHTTEQAK